MGVFGSGDKIQSAVDARIGVSDAGQYAGAGALIFNRSAKADNISPALNTDQIQSYTPIVIGVAAILALAFILNSKK